MIVAHFLIRNDMREMIGIDTNILARWVLRDDTAQCLIADEIMNGPIEISTSVLLEFGWLMGSVGKMSRAVLADSISAILSIELASIADREGLRWAVERYRQCGDWSDMIHLISLQNAKSFATFDSGIAKAAGTGTPVLVQTLRA
jgi:predicted nucleic-acid-binding protein